MIKHLTPHIPRDTFFKILKNGWMDKVDIDENEKDRLYAIFTKKFEEGDEEVKELLVKLVEIRIKLASFDMDEFKVNIGKKVEKCSITDKNPIRKKFKSGLYQNTIKGVMLHPYLYIPAYTFEEDESYVECRRCNLIEESHVDQTMH